MKKTIIHCDMDAFFASVEQLDHPEMRHKQVLVGGSRERGVVCACSYQTRSAGVHSGMAMWQALERCPEAVVLPVRMERYQEVSRQVFTIFSSFSDLVEPLSIDEAFLDVSGCLRLLGTGVEIARQIRNRVREDLGLPISAGVAPNKFLAKLASEEAKPDGLLEISPDRVDAFLLPLDIGKIWGVGRVMAEQLRARGVRTVADLRRLTEAQLESRFGSHGARLYALARGQDAREVETGRKVKSIGAEETFAADIWDSELLRRQLLALADRVAYRARREGVRPAGLTLKVKFADFSCVTRSCQLPDAEPEANAVWNQALALLQRTEAGRRGVRLLGLSLGGLNVDPADQGELFHDETRERRRQLAGALDEVHERYGADGIRRAALLDRNGSVQRIKQGQDGAE